MSCCFLFYFVFSDSDNLHFIAAKQMTAYYILQQVHAPNS